MAEWMMGECSIDVIMEVAVAKNMLKNDECDKIESRKIVQSAGKYRVFHTHILDV